MSATQTIGADGRDPDFKYAMSSAQQYAWLTGLTASNSGVFKKAGSSRSVGAGSFTHARQESPIARLHMAGEHLGVARRA